MFQYLGAFVTRHWLLTILIWVVIVVVVRSTTPAWDSVTHDGDLAYMPADMPSVVGERLLQYAFPTGRAKSEAVVVLAREDRPIDSQDIGVLKAIVAQMQNLLGISCYLRFQDYALQAQQADSATTRERAEEMAEQSRRKATAAWEEARQRDPTNAQVAHNLALAHAQEGDETTAEPLRALAWELDSQLQSQANRFIGWNPQVPEASQRKLLDVWSRYHPQFGDNLVSRDRKSNLIFLRLSDEFMAVENIPLVEQIEAILASTRSSMADWPDGLEVGLSGSAAVGSDMLRSAAESIRNTELYTVILVTVILLIVYRSPLLVVVPLVSIVVSLIVATGLVAKLTTLDQIAGMEWWNFKVFTTTKIFVVVILFGAGTDFCLFLISRYKEELDKGSGDKGVALIAALVGVGGALAASAFTTILGLATMFFADFGKFRNSGPAIGLCLLVTLLACLTLAPALLRGLGTAVYWKFRWPRFGKLDAIPMHTTEGGPSRSIDKRHSFLDRFWNATADHILARPGLILTVSIGILIPFFVMGLDVPITYDLLSELGPERLSKQGTELLRRHFPVGESGPIILLAYQPRGGLIHEGGITAVGNLADALRIPGIQGVRSLVEPTGEKRSATGRISAQNHPLARELFLSTAHDASGNVARYELILKFDPFSKEAIDLLQQVDDRLQPLKRDPQSFWSGGEFVFAGTTAAIRDLQEVTTGDNLRIQKLVVLAVLAILLVLLRRPAVCLYLILSVLFSYYVTIGAAEWYFQWAYGDTFHGLDWKVPLFLFVILVAIGQDYNIYLTTRVFEEQQHHGLMGGLREAIVRTGGIITSCGVIMAGTFLSMMSGSMRGIVELGFALTLGVLLDTFIVRPVLVPAFLALLFRMYTARQRKLLTR